ANEIVSIIGSEFKGKVVLHWYSGNKSTLKKAIDNGYYFSINFSMVNYNSDKELIKLIPLERLLLETDAPFVKFNDKPFSMLGIKEIIKELASILNIDKMKMATILWANFKDLIK